MARSDAVIMHAFASEDFAFKESIKNLAVISQPFFFERAGQNHHHLLEKIRFDSCFLSLFLFKSETTTTGNTWCDGTKSKMNALPLKRAIYFNMSFCLFIKVSIAGQCSSEGSGEFSPKSHGLRFSH